MEKKIKNTDQSAFQADPEAAKILDDLFGRVYVPLNVMLDRLEPDTQQRKDVDIAIDKVEDLMSVFVIIAGDSILDTIRQKYGF